MCICKEAKGRAEQLEEDVIYHMTTKKVQLWQDLNNMKHTQSWSAYLL